MEFDGKTDLDDLGGDNGGPTFTLSREKMAELFEKK